MSRSEAPGSSVGLLEQLEVRVPWLRAPVPLAGMVTAPGWRERTATALLAVQEPASVTSAGVLPGQTKCFAACWSAQVKLFSLECKWENGFKSEKHLNLKCPVMGAS